MQGIRKIFKLVEVLNRVWLFRQEMSFLQLRREALKSSIRNHPLEIIHKKSSIRNHPLEIHSTGIGMFYPQLKDTSQKLTVKLFALDKRFFCCLKSSHYKEPVIFLAILLFCVFLQELVMEKQYRLKESMKMMGLANWIHWLAWFLKNLLFLLISSVLLTILLKVTTLFSLIYVFWKKLRNVSKLMTLIAKTILDHQIK